MMKIKVIAKAPKAMPKLTSTDLGRSKNDRPTMKTAKPTPMVVTPTPAMFGKLSDPNSTQLNSVDRAMTAPPSPTSSRLVDGISMEPNIPAPPLSSPPSSAASEELSAMGSSGSWAAVSSDIGSSDSVVEVSSFMALPFPIGNALRLLLPPQVGVSLRTG